MGYKIHEDEYRNYMYAAVKVINSWSENLNNMLSAMNSIVMMDTFQGKAADSIKLYVYEIHMQNLIPMIVKSFEIVQSQMMLYDYKYQAVDNGLHRTIEEDVLNQTYEDYKYDRIMELSEEYGRLLGEIRDIIDLTNPSIKDITSASARVKFRVHSLDETVKRTEYSLLQDANSIAQQIESIKVYLQNVYNRTGVSPNSYETGMYEKVSGYQDAIDNINDINVYIEKNQSDITASQEYQKKTVADLRAEYEKAVEERKDNAQAQMITSGVGIVVSGSIIILTYGEGTPLAVTIFGTITGSCAGAYYVSNEYEAIQSYNYAMAGDITTEAWNPIRDTAFLGNQDIYQKWGETNVALQTLAIPSSRIWKAVSTTGYFSAGAEVLATEAFGMASGYLTDSVVSAGIDKIGETFNFSKTGLAFAHGAYDVSGPLKDLHDLKKSKSNGSVNSNAVEPNIQDVDINGIDANGNVGSADSGNSSSVYEEFNALGTAEEKYNYLLDKANTMDVSTEKNGSIFYAGRVNYANGEYKTARQIAERYADQLFANKGLTKLTLERTPGGKWMDDLGLYNKNADGSYNYESMGLTKQQVDNIWSTLSGRYAEGASGAVTAFSKNVPDQFKPETVFYSTELPNLRDNPNVTHINIR